MAWGLFGGVCRFTNTDEGYPWATHSTRGGHRLGMFESLISVGTATAIGVEGEMERGGRQAPAAG